MVIHGGSKSRHTMVVEINRTIYCMARTRYPWLENMPNTWPDIVQFLKSYTPLISTKVVRWKCPVVESYKCNSDGSSQVNCGVCSTAFCIRDGRGKLVYARASKLEVFSALDAETKGFKDGLLYCLSHNLFPLTMETDSLTKEDFGWDLGSFMGYFNRHKGD